MGEAEQLSSSNPEKVPKQSSAKELSSLVTDSGVNSTRCGMSNPRTAAEGFLISGQPFLSHLKGLNLSL